MSASNTRPAVHVLAGYRYQLLQSLDAWLSLQRDEVLCLETEEDFSIVSAENTTDVQVKSSAAANGPTPHSLQSSAVRGVLRRYWDRSNGGHDPGPRLAFIANGGAARERNLTFPNSAPGLIYWQAAARDADTACMRTALATVFADEPIGAWIEARPSDEELRARLLRRVHWMLEQSAEGPLTDLIRDKIAALYHKKGFLLTAANEGFSTLFHRVFKTACEPQQNDRQLTAIDLHKSIEEAVLPIAALQNAARAAGTAATDTAAGGLLVTRVFAPHPNIAERHQTVDEILERVRGEPVIWLYGSHGVGKSTLARLIATRLGGSWLMLDLRPLQNTDARAALAAWRELVHALLWDEEIQGIIVDDLVGTSVPALRPRLAALNASLAPRGVRTIVTSAHAPSPAWLAEVGASGNASLQAPYFTEGDVSALVRMGAAPPAERVEGWSRLIRITTYGGHPLLVSAKVASLRSRGWPEDALIEDIGPVSSDAVRATRDDARRRLLAEIPSSEARHLLRRIGTVFDRVEDALVLKLAHSEPAIPNAGDALAVLRGSWIEITPEGDLRLSPLIADISTDVSQDDALQWRQIAAAYWLSKRILDARTLPLCFWNAFLGQSTPVLLKLCGMIQTLPPDQLRGAAALLSPMTVLATDRPIYSGDPAIGTMLRLLQVEVANAVEDHKAAAKAAMRLVVEIDAVPQDELRLLMTSIAVPRVLFAEHVSITPAVQIEFALRLRAALEQITTISNSTLTETTAWTSKALPPGVSFPGLLFAATVTRIRSSERMLGMIEALNGLSESDRNTLMGEAALALQMSVGSFVHNGWAQEQLDNVDLAEALVRYERMTEITRPWIRPETKIQLATARSVILDEGLSDGSAALETVDAAMAEFGESPALVRQKAKVLAHAGDDHAAAHLVIGIEDTVAVEAPFERALALRDGAVSAARAGLFPDAVRLFRKAYDALMREEARGLAVGIQVEIALTLWAMKNQAGALIALADALDAVALLDPCGSRQNEQAHQFSRAVAGLFLHDLDPYPSTPRPQIAFGRASALAGAAEPLLRPDLKPLPDNWRLLALCEITSGVDVGIELRSLAKQTGPGLGSIEMFIAFARYSRAILGDDIEGVFRLGLLAASAKATVLSAAHKEDRRVTAAQLESQSIQMLVASGCGAFIRSIPLDLLVWHRFRGMWDASLPDRIRTACAATWGDSSCIADILAATSSSSSTKADTAASQLTAMLVPTFDPRGKPKARFRRDLLLLDYMIQSSARRLLEPLVVGVITEGWSAAVEQEGFALRAPLQHAPAIQAAIVEARRSGLRGAARVLIATSPAVGFQLSQEWLTVLRQLSGNAGSNDAQPA